WHSPLRIRSRGLGMVREKVGQCLAILAALGCGVIVSSPALAQRAVPMANGIPVAPTGVADNPLPKGPFRYRTAEGMDIRVEVVARDIAYPMALTFLPNRDMLIVTRKGELHLLKPGAGKSSLVAGGPAAGFA